MILYQSDILVHEDQIVLLFQDMSKRESPRYLICNDLFASALNPERCTTCLQKWERKTDKPKGLDIKDMAISPVEFPGNWRQESHPGFVAITCAA
jgi:hypothetical protein